MAQELRVSCVFFFLYTVLNTNKGVYAKEMHVAHKVYNVYYLVLSMESRALYCDNVVNSHVSITKSIIIEIPSEHLK